MAEDLSAETPQEPCPYCGEIGRWEYNSPGYSHWCTNEDCYRTIYGGPADWTAKTYGGGDDGG